MEAKQDLGSAGGRLPGRWRRLALSLGLVVLSVPLLLRCVSRPAPDEPAATPLRLVLQGGHRLGVTDFAINDEGSLVASLGGGSFLSLWNVTTGRQYASCDLSQEDQPLAITFHGKDVIVSHRDNTLTQWSAATCVRQRSVDVARGSAVLPPAVSVGNTGFVITADRGRLILLRGSDLAEIHGIDLIALGGNDAIQALAASDDGGLLAAGSAEGDIWLLRVDTGRAVITHHVSTGESVEGLAFADGELFSVLGERTIRWWNLTADGLTGGEAFRPPRIGRLLGGLALDRRGEVVEFDAIDDSLEELDTLISWDVRRRAEIGRTAGAKPQRCRAGCVSAHIVHQAIEVVLPGGARRELRGLIEPVTGIAFQPGTSRLATGGGGGSTLIWDLATGQVRRMPGEGTSGITNLAFSPDGELLAASAEEGSTHVWSWKEERTLQIIPGVERQQALAFSSDSSTLVLGSESGIRLWRRGSPRSLQAIEDIPTTMRAVQLLPGAHRLLTAGSEFFRAWDLRQKPRLAGSEQLPNSGLVCCAAFSSRGNLLATTSEGQDDLVRIYETAGLKQIASLAIPIHGDLISALSFTSDDRKLLAAGPRTYVWDLPTRVLERTVESSHSTGIDQVAMASNHRQLATASLADAAKVTDLGSGKVFTLAQGGEGSWVAVSDSDQRFDTNDFESLRALSWVVPDSPSQALPVEVFMRDYFEPRLLPRLLAGERLPPVRRLASLNLARPEVRIVDVRREEGSPDLVRVRLNVRSTHSLPSATVGGRPRESGVCDLRLFRDGQLVGQYPPLGSVVEQTTGAQDSDAERESWRRNRCIIRHGQLTVEIPRVRLPRRKGQRQVVFKAYAFNEDRVKSDTASRTVPLPSDLAARAGTAYVISVGVNRTDSSPEAWNLEYAANDAFELSRVLEKNLSNTRGYARVVPVRLVSDHPGKPRGEGAATKRHLKIVLDLLAGREIPAGHRDEIAGAGKIERARPEDLIVLAVSSHGFTDAAGGFHFVLSDIGRLEQRVTAELARRTLSSGELSAWLREVDAGDLALIVDACQSEATVESDGFKPGPMGSRGLGQLAYDKGMRVLAASKAKESAFEGRGVRHGLLSYALILQGLEGNRADWRPPDGRITVGEWLSFAEQQVPQLFGEGELKGTVEGLEKGGSARHAYHGAGRTPARYQQPVLFDFADQRREPVLAEAHHRLREKGEIHAQHP